DEARFERGLARWKLRLLALLERRNARRADRVVVPSHYSANHAIRAYGLPEEKVRVVPEAVDPSPWERLRTDPPARDDRAPTILTVGHQYPRKNTRTLIRAFSKVAQHVPDARLRVVGGGPELPGLKRQAATSGLEDRVELLGALPRTEDVRREYFRADCFCLPTLQEGFGIVFLEAMSAGLPVVAGRAGAVPEVVSEGETGLLVNPRDPDAVADALIAVLTDGGLAKRLGNAGRERAARFTPERTATEFLEVARSAVRAHPSSAA
ncbi:MAG: glycosyltransferase family 4 protein, partial [Longimicrobiales bacterium]|nr:glycosyltransferase family 4 protein [Longimicrobiales bacterium]